MFVKLANNAFKEQAKQYSVNITQNDLQTSALKKQALQEAQKALDTYNNEVYGPSNSKDNLKVKLKQSFKFDVANHQLKDIDIKDLDLASLKTEDLNIKIATQDSDILLQLWKKNPKEFLNNKI